MLRTAALLSVLIASQSAAFSEEAKPDTVEVHGKALVLSCMEWKRNSDGSWSNVGPLLVGDAPVKEVTLHGKDTKVLEDKCGNGAPPTATPAKSADAPRHMGHRHGSQEPPPGGT